jgi:hypothetical protein
VSRTSVVNRICLAVIYIRNDCGNTERTDRGAAEVRIRPLGETVVRWILREPLYAAVLATAAAGLSHCHKGFSQGGKKRPGRARP